MLNLKPIAPLAPAVKTTSRLPSDVYPPLIPPQTVTIDGATAVTVTVRRAGRYSLVSLVFALTVNGMTTDHNIIVPLDTADDIVTAINAATAAAAAAGIVPDERLEGDFT